MIPGMSQQDQAAQTPQERGSTQPLAQPKAQPKDANETLLPTGLRDQDLAATVNRLAVRQDAPATPTATGSATPPTGLTPTGEAVAETGNQRVRLARGQMISLGSAPDNDIVLAHESIAPHHARLARNGVDEYTLTDLGSSAGTFVNGYAVRHAELIPGAEVRIGPYRYHFTGDELQPITAEHGIDVDAIDLREWVHVGGLIGGQRKMLLDDISLSIPPGAFVALVGGSGAGKTMLLNALSGQHPAQQGAVLYDGINLYQNATVLNETFGYVPQDDIIHRNLTVQRALYYAARLRLPQGTSRREINERIREVLDDIEMLPQRRQLISQLSGGQRKRVNIAVELLARPPLFFLDEPNSGLDPGLDLKLMQLLRRLADRGHTVVLATHETRNIDQCDYICFLAPGGRLAYFGPPASVKRFFGTNDYAAIYNMLFADPAKWTALFRQSPDYLKYVAGPRLQSQNRRETVESHPLREPTKRSGDQPLRQFFILTMRYLELMVRDRINLLILLAQAPIIAGLVVMLANTNEVHQASLPGMQNALKGIYAQTDLFIVVASAIWFGTINAAREIVKEAPIYRRERAVNLHVAPYIFSKLVVLGALSFFQCLALLWIVGHKAGYPERGIFIPGLYGAFIEMFFTLLLCAFAGLGIGLLISALAPNTDRAVSFVPILLIPQIIFGNVIFTLHGVGNTVSYIMPSRWGMEAMGSIARLLDKYTDHAGQSFYQSNGPHLLGYWGALVLIGLVCLVLTYVFLRRRDTVVHAK